MMGWDETDIVRTIRPTYVWSEAYFFLLRLGLEVILTLHGTVRKRKSEGIVWHFFFSNQSSEKA